jgi:hypothetical protein
LKTIPAPVFPIAAFRRSLLVALLASSLVAVVRAESNDTRDLIAWLLAGDRQLANIPFADVILDATGKRILPVDPVADKPWLTQLSSALDRTLTALNDPAQPIHQAARINEASRYIEDQLHDELNKIPGWKCTIPLTSSGEEQRSGYPDLRLALPDGSFVLLDPKLFDPDSRTSTLRTFYYEPRTLTNKIHEDARHLLVGIRHNGKPGPELQLLGWELIDVSKLRVQLKAEFQASNKDIYQNGNTVARSSTPPDEAAP